MQLTHRFVALLLGLLVLTTTATAIDEQTAQLIEQTKADYQPVTPEEVDRARSELAGAAVELEQFLVPGSDRGERWKQYLQWQGVQKALTEGAQPNLSELRSSLDKFRSGAVGLDLPPFLRTAAAIQRYADLATIERAGDQHAFVDRQLALLTKYIDRYEQQPSGRARFEIERRIDFFVGIDRATALTTYLLGRFNQPNICSEVSERFLNRVGSRPVDDVGPVTDCILGTSIRGTGHTTGEVTIETVPSPDRALLVLHLTGVTHSETRGYNSPVVIRSSGTTPFTATKRIGLQDTNFWNYPAKVTATTATITRSVKKQGGGLGSNLVARIGEQRVAEKKPQADRIAARHAEERIGRKLDDELLPRLQDARYEYEQQFKQPLAVRDAEPRSIVFSTTDHSLNVTMLEAGRGELGSDTAPPAFDGTHDVAIRVHDSGASNMASAILGGATLSQGTRESDPELDVDLPQALQEAFDKAREENADEQVIDDEREFKPWSIRFRRQRPVTVEFADEHVNLRLHASRITVADDTYDGWDIVVRYGMHAQHGGLILVRVGEIEVIPSGFDPADGGGLNSRQVSTRGVLAKELNRQAEAGRGFPEEITLPMIDLPDDMAEHGPLLLQHSSSKDGWLSLGWVLPE